MATAEVSELQPGDRVTLHILGGTRQVLVNEITGAGPDVCAGGTRRDRPELRSVISATAVRHGLVHIVLGWDDSGE
jgi:hypothetical protein